MLVWTDIETTGLEPRKERILEVAVIATDDQLNELGTFTAVTDEAATIPFNSLDPFVRDMHTKNGLWFESLRATERTDQVGERLRAWLEAMITTHAPVIDGKVHMPQLAGSTISFDRAFLKEHMPRVEDALHYRNLDVGTLNEVGRRFWPEVHAKRPGAGGKPEDAKHRALDDIRDSIAALKHYLAHVGPRGTVTGIVAATSAPIAAGTLVVTVSPSDAVAPAPTGKKGKPRPSTYEDADGITWLVGEGPGPAGRREKED